MNAPTKPKIFDDARRLDGIDPMEQADTSKNGLMPTLIGMGKDFVKRIADIVLWEPATKIKIERPSGEGWNSGNSRF